MAGTITVTLTQQSSTTAQATMRDHQVLIDRPVAKEGTDLGPMGGELLLAALGGCFMSNLLAAVRARNLDITNIEATVTGTLADAPSRFSAIAMEVSAQNTAPELLAKLVTIAERACLVANTLRVAVDLRITTLERVP